MEIEWFHKGSLLWRTASGIICCTTDSFIAGFYGHFATLRTRVTCNSLNIQRIGSRSSFRDVDQILTSGLATREETTWIFLIRGTITRKFSLLTIIMWSLSFRCHIIEASWSELTFFEQKRWLLINNVFTGGDLEWLVRGFMGQLSGIIQRWDRAVSKLLET